MAKKKKKQQDETIYRRYLISGHNYGFYVKKEGKNCYLGFMSEERDFAYRQRISKNLYGSLLFERIIPGKSGFEAIIPGEIVVQSGRRT